MSVIRARSAKLWLSLALLSVSQSLSAQISLVNLGGSVKDSSGSAIAAAKVVAKNLNTAATRDSRTDSVGNFGLSLEPGAYELSITADGFESKTAMVTIAPNAAQSLTFRARAARQFHGWQFAQRPFRDPDWSVPIRPWLPTGADAEQCERTGTARQAYPHAQDPSEVGLDHRSAIAGNPRHLGRRRWAQYQQHRPHGAYGIGGSHVGPVLHERLFVIRAPRVPGTTTRGPIRLHKALAWVHGPGMILTPILGALAYDQKSKGEKVHGIASAHGPVAAITAAAFGAALLSVSVKF